MAKLRRGSQASLSDDASLRLRAAWLYHAYGLTQNEVADQLGIGRSTVIRLLEDAKQLGEVRIWIEEGGSESIQLAIELERHLKLDEAIVVPSAGNVEQAAKAVGLALGKFLSETIGDNMTIGVGWGRTLTASLAAFHPPKHSGVRVMSLLGGAVQTQFANPFEYSWRLATALNAECFLFPAPIIVDSTETKRRLMEDCGIDRLSALAASLDLAVVSAGDISDKPGSLVSQFITQQEHRELLELGCVADVMANFIDTTGKLVPHALNQRSMSVGLEALRNARHIVLASGGAARATAILSVIRAIGCNTLITDESAAKVMLTQLK
jgi:DNA-binding transcriptional regulator LsrR (DeoR family)